MNIEELEKIDLKTLSKQELESLLVGVQRQADTECYKLGIEYNIKDVELIFKLEDKLKLIELAITLAYDTKSNFEDVFAQTRMWDAMTYSYLLEKNIIVPPREVKDKDSAFEGAYVKEPVPGMYDWVASFDLNSLYPNLMRQYNISPETIVDKREIYDRIEFLESLL